MNTQQTKENALAKMVGLFIDCGENNLVREELLSKLKNIHKEMLKLSFDDLESEKSSWVRSLTKVMNEEVTKLRVSQINKDKNG